MILDAGTLFDTNEAAFSAAMGTPESMATFNEQYIEPALKEHRQDGQELQAAFWKAVCDYQRGGFIAGFQAATQLLMSCMPGNVERGQCHGVGVG